MYYLYYYFRVKIGGKLLVYKNQIYRINNNFRRNELTKLTSSFENLSSLMSLNASYNTINSISKELFELTNLRQLDLSQYN